MEPLQIIEQIKHAFASVLYPGDDNIVPKTQYDDETQITEAELLGKRWNELTLLVEDFSYGFSLSFLTPMAYHYYLPAFLISSVELEEDANIVSETIWSLTPPEESNNNGVFYSRMVLLTPEQHSAIAVFVGFFIENNPQKFRLKSGMRNLERIKNFWLKN